MAEEGIFIVFGDKQNEVFDESYANELIQEFRKQTGWKVEENTRIWNELRDFSKLYSRKKRNVAEVVVIFRMASQCEKKNK